MEKNTIKFYNIIFPFFIMVFIPPYIIVAIIGNLIIDASIIIIILKKDGYYDALQKSTIKITILKIFGLGFLADIIGMSVLITLYGLYQPTINYFRIWDNPISIIAHLSVIVITGVLIFFFNKFIFSRLHLDKKTVFKLSMAMAIITAPWTFLIPMNLFTF